MCPPPHPQGGAHILGGWAQAFWSQLPNAKFTLFKMIFASFCLKGRKNKRNDEKLSENQHPKAGQNTQRVKDSNVMEKVVID